MTYLDSILDARRAAIARAKSQRPLAAVRAAAELVGRRRDFTQALVASPGLSVIAEFKRSSPSAGAIAPHAEAGSVASAYERAGAAALSVLTEPERFRGGFVDLRAARAATSLPVLCKDFVIDDYQIWEAAAHGADALLLIVAAMEPEELSRRFALAVDAGMTPLVEAHDEAELATALRSGASVIGVNNRDLRSFVVDTSTASRLRALMPAGVVSVAESGYRCADDLAGCAAAGYDAVLVGEALMRELDPGQALASLRSGIR